MTQTFDLFFAKPDKGNKLKPLWAQVSVKSSELVEDGLAKGYRLISGSAATIDEFDERIDYLISELEEIRKRARAEFAAATR
jgi:hypothetical protein